MKSYDIPQVYEDLGIRIPDLGCIMLGVEPIAVTGMVENGAADLHVSSDSMRWWVDGATAEAKAHITLLYGLMQPGPEWREHVDAVLDGWELPALRVKAIGAFPSPYPDEPYSCIVAHIEVTPELLDAHQRLSLLPHINTFPEYTPHVTLAYVEEGATQKWIDTLNDVLQGEELTPTELDYGGDH